MHRGGKIGVEPTVEVPDRAALAMAYTPGVARVCSAIADQPELAGEYTWTGNTVAVVSDGTAVLGLGDIGPAAAMPVMEGKALLFKKFAGINAVPICIDVTDVDAVVAVVTALAPSFGGINLEDISAPRCFEIEDRLRAALDIPVMHDDQHGTAIVALAALRSRRPGGRQGTGRDAGRGLRRGRVRHRGLQDPAGGGHRRDRRGRQQGHDLRRPGRSQPGQGRARPGDQRLPFRGRARGGAARRRRLHRAVGRDAARGRPRPDGARRDRVPALQPRAGDPPDVARRHAAVVATGRSDFPNQINNSLAFPGVFRAALDVRATAITENMKLAAADAIAALVGDDAAPDYVIPSQFDERVAPAVAAAVAAQARLDGVARR